MRTAQEMLTLTRSWMKTQQNFLTVVRDLLRLKKIWRCCRKASTVLKRVLNKAVKEILDILHGIMFLLAFLCIFGVPIHAAELGTFVSGGQTGAALQTVQIGLAVEWKHVAVNLSHGVQRTQWRVPEEPEWQNYKWQAGTTVGVRIYPFNTETIRPLLIWNHVSDIIRGKPFNDENEPTSDYFGVGVTVVIKRFEFDVTYGSFGRECYFTSCDIGSRTSEFKIGFRGYFWK